MTTIFIATCYDDSKLIKPQHLDPTSALYNFQLVHVFEL